MPLPEIEVVDTGRLIDALGLDRDEKRYFVANKLNGIPRRRLAAVLGWKPARVAAVQVRLNRRLACQRGTLRRDDFVMRGGGDSRRPWYRDGRTYELSVLGKEFEEIMNEELNFLSNKPFTDRNVSNVSA